MENFENKLKLGNGIYTTKDIANILRLPYAKVRTWINKYWDGELGKAYEHEYSWTIQNSKAVGFHTLVEFYIMMQFIDAGVSVRNVLKAHKELSSKFNTPFPFAQKVVIENIKTDSTKIYLTTTEGDTITLDGSKQLNLEFIKVFFKNLDFDNDLIASKYWPLGKEHNIVCDPKYKFGQPVIAGTNIQAEAIYNMYLAKDSIEFIADIYEIDQSRVKDAIKLCKSAA